MEPKRTINLLLSLLIPFFWTIMYCHAQTPMEAPRIIVPKELSIGPGINSLDLKVSASHISGFKGTIRLLLPDGADLLGRGLNELEIGRSMVRYLSIKFRMDRAHLVQDPSIILEIRDSSGRRIESDTIRLIVPPRRVVKMANETLFQYIRNFGDSIETRVRVSNLGTQTEMVKIVYSSDDRIGKSQFLENTLELPPGKDTLLSRSFLVERFMLQRNQYSVSVSGMYQNSDLIDNLSLIFTNISSHRDYTRMFPRETGGRAWLTPNYLELMVDNLTSALPTYHLRAQGDYALLGGRSRFSAMIYHMGGMSRPIISNTYLELAIKGNGLSLGNIQETFEMPVYGSGVSFSQLDTSKMINYTVGLLERSSDLLAHFYGQGLGYVAYGKLERKARFTGKSRYQTQIVLERNSLDSTKSLLLYNQVDLLAPATPQGTTLSARLGLGLHGLDGGEPWQRSIPSAAGGLNFTWHPGKWRLQSEGFYSSPYYPGIRRGTLQVSNRLSRNWKKASLSFDQTFMDQSPRYLVMNSFLYHQRSSRISASVFAPISPRINIGLVPRLLSEQTRLQTILAENIMKTSSVGLLFSGNLRSADLRHHLNLSLENALVARKDRDEISWAMRADMGYSYRGFAMNGSFQRGAMQSLDLIGSNSMVVQPDRFSLNARIGGTLLDGSLRWNAGSMAFLSRDYGGSYGINLDVKYRVLPRTELQGNLQLSKNTTNLGQAIAYNNLRIGVRQVLPYKDPAASRTSRGTVLVQCFYDSNGNGIYDADEKPAVFYDFSIGDFLLTTDRQGRASFTSLPYGPYKLYFPSRENYLADSRNINLDNRKMYLNIPLRLGGEVRGGLEIDYVPGISREVDYELKDVRLLAFSSSSRYEIICDSRGEFRTSLPEGKYSLQLDLQSLPEDIVHNGYENSIHVRAGEILQLPRITLSVREKRIEVKRFGNP